jgi:hypothetical protein
MTAHIFAARASRRWAVAAGLLALPSCGLVQVEDLVQPNPVHEAAVQALGPEQPGVPQGPYHRAGQPCTVCHSGQGPARTIFSLAGTVFSAPFAASADAGPSGVDQAAIGVVDDNGSEQSILTNCVGNFYVTPDVYSPAFPILVNVSKQGAGVVPMMGHIGRETSCAECHSDPPGTKSPGHIFLLAPASASDASCPVSPVAGQGR